jgi:glyoxylase-like metal-dependent hydrolase (beta-lactamase superfamily II)
MPHKPKIHSLTMRIIPLSEGQFTIDQTKLFVPFDPQHDDLQQRPTGSLLVEIQPFLLITSKDVILVDTGLGFCGTDGQLQIHRHLREHGIEPEMVTKVLLSHLHKDHAGGLSSVDVLTQTPILNFPKAIYYVGAAEYAFACSSNGKSYQTAMLSILEQTDQVVFLETAGEIDGYIHYETSGGHAPHHLVFWIHDQGQTVFYGGDEAPQLRQMKSRFVAKYDFDGKKAMELRRTWWEQGNREGWTFLFYHDIQTPTITCPV